MKRYVFILLAADGGEIDRTIVNANDRKEAVKHMRMYIRWGRKFRCYEDK